MAYLTERMSPVTKISGVLINYNRLRQPDNDDESTKRINKYLIYTVWMKNKDHEINLIYMYMIKLWR